MNKFTAQIEILSAVSDVVDTLKYHLDDETQQKQYYSQKIEDAQADGDDIDEEHYLARNVRERLNKRNVYEELIQYLEKKYLK